MANLRNHIIVLSQFLWLFGINCVTGLGAQWSEMSAGLDNRAIHALVIDPKNPASVYAATTDGVYGSINGGTAWGNLGLTRVRALALDFTNSNILYAETLSGGTRDFVLFKSTDRGMTWSNTGPREFDFTLLAMDPTDPKTLLIGSVVQGSLGGDLFLKKTVDGGETWMGLSGVGLCCTLARS